MKIWRSLFDETCRREILKRLDALQADSPPRWGRMSAPQMVAHLTDQMRHAMGNGSVEPRAGMLRWHPVRWASIYLLPWPKGRIKGPPEAFTTKPRSWVADVRRLATLVETFSQRDPRGEWPEHALLGPLSGRDWGVFCHKHFDHHLRQFGV